VQGVGFRQHTALRARSLGLTGWVANLPDGSVDAAFEGQPERVESMVGWCRRGPAGASVDDVDVWDETPVGGSDFQVTFAPRPSG
jgi:acylphosphatase